MKFFICCIAAVLLCACSMSPNLEEGSGSLSQVQLLPLGSELPELVAGPDGPALLWLQSATGGDAPSALRWARWDAQCGGWRDTVEIASGAGWLVNWADRPSLAFGSGGRAWAHWLELDERGDFAYGIRTVRSIDSGRSWSDYSTPHRDTAVAEHGFGRWLPHGEGAGATFVWLDGRDFDGHPEPAQARMEVRAADWLDGASWSVEQILDSSACTCCPLSDTPWRDGHAVAYRDRHIDRGGEETRDFSLLIQGTDPSSAGLWSPPTAISPDGWKISGCPVNGAAMAANSNMMLAVWFTAAADSARVLFAQSSDGVHFSSAQQLNLQGRAVGRVASCTDGAGDFYAVWLEALRDGTAVMGRHWDSSGRPLGSPEVLMAGSDQRAAGFPTMTGLDRGALLAWTIPADPRSGAPPQIQTAALWR